MNTLKYWVTVIYGGLALFGLLVIVVFATGQTFGQRCAKIWVSGSPDWHSCVHTFAEK